MVVGPPPSPAPAAGKQPADVLAGLSPQQLNEVVVHLSPTMLQNCVHSIGAQHQTAFCVEIPGFFKFFIFVAHSSCVLEPAFLGSSILTSCSKIFKPDGAESELLQSVSKVIVTMPAVVEAPPAVTPSAVSGR